MDGPQLAFKRVLLKLSGEMLAGDRDGGWDDAVVGRVADEIAAARADGVDLGVVIGGGNLFRGLTGARGGMDRVRGDHMGMLATVMNALAMQDALEHRGCPSRVLSALAMPTVAEPCTAARARACLAAGEVVFFAGGTGNPFFSTDTAAALRAAEMGAEVLLKGTKVDGVYDKDPERHADARRFDHVTHLDVVQRGLRVMDLTAASLCLENRIPIIVFDFTAPGRLARVLRGEPLGTRVTATT